MIEMIIDTAIKVIVTAIVTALIAIIKVQGNKVIALETGMQCILRCQIIEIHNRYMEKGYCPIYERENLEHAYKAYKALKGNGVIDGLYKATLELPTEKQDD